MSHLSEEDAKLASQCLEICQTLAGKSLSISFSFNIGPNFSFSVDTRGKEVLASPKKKKTPSTLRRDARRRDEFLKKKQNAQTPEKAFKCDQCEGTFKSENGLKIHIGKAHKNVNSTPATPDCLRQQLGSSVNLSASPLLDAKREEEGSDENSEDDSEDVSEDVSEDDIKSPAEAPNLCCCGCGAPERCPRHFEVMESRKQILNMILDQTKRFNLK